MIATDALNAPCLLEPFELSPSFTLRNRICMGSMTRNRNTDANKPTSAAVQYYTDRARDGAGLIIAEGTFVSPTGSEWLHAPLMTSPSYALAWKPITSAVHSVGGTIFFQPWHEGRAQNELAPMLQQTGYPVLAPSAIPAKAGKYRFLSGSPGHTHNITPMTLSHIDEVIAQYAHSCSLAKTAGFDGVEIIAQGGYLVHSFLCTRSNTRSDAYGGSAANRCRFLLEVVDAIAGVYPMSHIGVKIAPCDNVTDIACSYAELSETYTLLIRELVAKGIGFVNLTRRGCAKGEPNDDFSDSTVRPQGMELPVDYEPLDEFGPLVKYEGSRTKLMVNYGYSVEEAEELVRQGRIDLITFGRPFIYNPVSGALGAVKRPFNVKNRILLSASERTSRSQGMIEVEESTTAHMSM
jgi:2,4-dienoyl-CoA reductase-like NADH-dependent reductase (Old Yellow Enzyme family)